MKETSSRFRFDPTTRLIGVRVGKVELGQHIHEAYEIVVAQILAVPPLVVRVLQPSTVDSPDDGLTVGSLSIQMTGQTVAKATKILSEVLQARAAQRLSAAIEDVVLDPEALSFLHGTKSCDLFDIVAEVAPDLIGSVPDNGPASRLVPDAVTGSRMYLQDMTFPGMLHARALRGRALEEVIPFLPTGCRLIRDGGFAAVLSESDAALQLLWSRLQGYPADAGTAWDGPITGWGKTARRITTQKGDIPAMEADAEYLTITASRPFLLHGSIAPSCAIACWQNDRLEVWTHSQGIFPLRDQIARVLMLELEAVVVHHVPSAGCYGHTAADDAALDAALVAIQTEGCKVRVAWPRLDELRHGPVGAPMLVEANLSLDKNKRITHWHHEIWSPPHGQRPGGGGHVNLLAATERDPIQKPIDIEELPVQIGSGAGRNAEPIYAIPSLSVTTHILQDLPVRTSSLRGLGTQVNTLAIEAAMDSLAVRTGETPFDIRSRHLDDPRARQVLEKLEIACRAATETVTGTIDEFMGIGLGRYKNKAAIAAVAARIRLEDEPRLLELWAVVDAGYVVNPDGAMNQIEGGMVQAASWTLCEGTLLRNGRIEAEGWEDYPTLGWADIPLLHIELVEHEAQTPPLGVGECMVGPTSAAIVNAIGKALGQNFAHLPLDRARLIEALA